MRIVSRKDLMALPAGTVYSPFHGNVGECLYAFGGVFGSDFTMCSLLDDFNEERSEDRSEVLERMARGEDVPLVFGEDTCWQRDGMFDDKQQYAVWSKADLLGLAAFLTKAAEVAR